MIIWIYYTLFSFVQVLSHWVTFLKRSGKVGSWWRTWVLDHFRITPSWWWTWRRHGVITVSPINMLYFPIFCFNQSWSWSCNSQFPIWNIYTYIQVHKNKRILMSFKIDIIKHKICETRFYGFQEFSKPQYFIYTN